MNNNKIKILALFGKSGAGKDTVLEKITTDYPNVNKIVSCTTRPKRDYEENGIQYYFLSTKDFLQQVKEGKMLEATEFRDWLYGTPLWALDSQKINIGVFNIAGITKILENPNLEVLPLFISAPDKVRLERALNREDDPDCLEICRRFLTDEKDFSKIPFNFLTFDNVSEEFDDAYFRAYMDKLLK